MLGCLVAVAVPLAGFAALVLATATPTPHPIHTPGAAEVKTREYIDRRPLFDSSLPAPTMSLDDLRCAAWRTAETRACPDAATLALQMWTDATQAPQTLYVAVHEICGTLAKQTNGFNVEYIGSQRTLTLHCYSAQAWLQFPNGTGSREQSSMFLIDVSTQAIHTGSVSVFEDDRVEHLVGDDSTQTLLGIVTIT
jgi:hypothetical protein